MYEKRSKLKPIVAGLLVLGILLMVTIHFVTQQPSYAITQSYAAPAGFANVANFGTNDLVYSNGQALMIYDVETGTSTALSPSVGLSGSPIDSLSVSPDNQYVLFHDEIVAPNGKLYQQLQNQNLNAQLDYWWLYSVASQSFRPLPQLTLLAKLSGDQVVALASAGNSESITTYDAASLSAQTTFSIPGSTDFSATANGLLLQSAENQVLSTKNGVVSTIVASNATMVGATADGQQLVVVLGQGSARQLAVLDLVQHTQKIIANNLVGQPVWSASLGTVLYTTNDTNTNTNTVYSYNLVAHKSWLWSFSGAAAGLQNSSLTPAALAGAQAAVISRGTNYYIIGSSIARPQ